MLTFSKPAHFPQNYSATVIRAVFRNNFHQIYLELRLHAEDDTVESWHEWDHLKMEPGSRF